MDQTKLNQIANAFEMQRRNNDRSISESQARDYNATKQKQKARDLGQSTSAYNQQVKAEKSYQQKLKDQNKDYINITRAFSKK